jgi:hypothetical protein
VLKVYRDVNRDGRGEKPLTAEQVLRERTAEEFAREDIGYLTKPVAVAEWIDTVRRRYQFLHDMTDDERRWAACNALAREYGPVEAGQVRLDQAPWIRVDLALAAHSGPARFHGLTVKTVLVPLQFGGTKMQRTP